MGRRSDFIQWQCMRGRGAAVIAVALLAGCAQPGSRQAGREEPCNPVAGAVIGGAIGAIAGSDRNRAGRALIGAGVGALACMAINYHSQQTRSAEQVGADYRARNSELPPAPIVTTYRTQTGRSTARAGEDITVTSTIEVVPGRNEPLKELREEFSIVDPAGVQRSRLAKTPAPAGSQGGSFVSTLQFTFPQGVPPGAYQVQSKLFVNGRPVQDAALKIQIARGADGRAQVVALQDG